MSLQKIEFLQSNFKMHSNKIFCGLFQKKSIFCLTLGQWIAKIKGEKSKKNVYFSISISNQMSAQWSEWPILVHELFVFCYARQVVDKHIDE